MAFTGTPVVVKLGKYTAFISGVTLAAGATGVIGLDGSGAEVELPEGFPTINDEPSVSYYGCVKVDVTMRTGGGAVDVRINKTAAGGAAMPVSIVNSGAGATGDLEIYVEYLVSQER